MRRILESSAFRRDVKREARGRHGAQLAELLSEVLQALATDQALLARYRDHALTGNWRSCRDCHIKPDLVLIYRKPDADHLELLRLGSQPELRL